MKVILLALFIMFIINSIKGMTRINKVILTEYAEENKLEIEQAKLYWRRMAHILLFLTAILYIWVSNVAGSPYIIIGSAIAIVLSGRGWVGALKAIEKGELISKPSFEGLYSIVFKGYIIYVLVMDILGITL